MTLYEFNNLDETGQAETVWSGTFVADRQDAEHRILLYQVDSFYVEVYYHIGQNVIIRVRSFSSTAQLEPYLNSLDLNQMF